MTRLASTRVLCWRRAERAADLLDRGAGKKSVPNRPLDADTSASADVETTPSRVPGPRLERRPPSGSAREQVVALSRAIFRKSTEVMAITDQRGRSLEQNAAHERLAGYSEDELRGKIPAIHLGGVEFQNIAAELRATGACRRDDVSRSKDRRVLTLELSSFAMRESTGEPVCYVAIKRDVTTQKRAAAKLRKKLDQLQAIYRTADSVARAGALEDICAAALDKLQRTVGANRASVLLYDDGVTRFKAWNSRG